MSAKYLARIFMFSVLGFPGLVHAGGPNFQQAHSRVTAWKTVIALGSGHNLSGMAVDMRGSPRSGKWAYTVDTSTGHLLKFGTGGKLLGSWSVVSTRAPGAPVGIAVGDSGNVFIADPEVGRVSKLSPSGQLLNSWSGFVQPRAIGVLHNGNLLVAEQGAQRVTVLTSSGVVLRRITLPWENHTASPAGVATTSKQDFYVAATCFATACTSGHADRQDQVLRLTTSGSEHGIWIGGTAHGGWVREQEPWITIQSIAADPNGNWLVSGLIRWPYPGTNTHTGVMAYGPTGIVQGFWKLPTTASPDGLAIVGRTIYVAQGDRVLKLVR